MKLEMTGQMRLEQRMKLAPHMIQSMEILQLPILALQERIEQELNSNPVLEIDEPDDSDNEQAVQEQPEDVGAAEISTESASENIESFARLDNLNDYYPEYANEDAGLRRSRSAEGTDKKLEAIKNTAAAPQSLHEYLMDQWRLIDGKKSIKIAGEIIINYIDNRGYLSVRLEQLHNKDRKDFKFDDLQSALLLVQQLEPAGVGARDIKECLLIQLSQYTEDTSFENVLVEEHMENLLANRLPEIARDMKCSINEINRSIEQLSKLDTSPGLQISQAQNIPVRADVIVEASEQSDEYIVHLADTGLPNLRISNYYEDMLKDKKSDMNTQKFLQNNIRSAQWIIEAIEQRKRTLLKVARAIVNHQQDFFKRGQMHLKPLPMSKIADDVGIHLATVSRAVAGKYLQCSFGIIALRKFFSGGTEDVNGQPRSWEAVRAKLQQIIDAEDKSRPLSDDQIRKKLGVAGIENIARRTVAKYRNLMNIPAARFRKKF